MKHMDKSEKLLSTLSWTKADFENAGDEIPDELLENDIHTEGELMSREDIDSWLTDTHKTFLILGESSSDKFHRLFDEYVVDIHYLEELGKITPEEAEKLINIDNFTF